ncbi:hypothetical protein, partial [Streptomyces albus]|uniref:hypothetical protein n=1 Tax=Streptomyces albus TaxID=1888 RepID=UPI0006E3A447
MLATGRHIRPEPCRDRPNHLFGSVPSAAARSPPRRVCDGAQQAPAGGAPSVGTASPPVAQHTGLRVAEPGPDVPGRAGTGGAVGAGP